MRERNQQNMLIITFVLNDDILIHSAMLQYYDFKEMLFLFIF